jgi:DNA repair ATPase RecN
MPIIFLYSFGVIVLLFNAGFSLFMWSKVKNIEYSTQNLFFLSQDDGDNTATTNHAQNEETNSLSDEYRNLTLESKQKRQNEIARIQEDILSRNLPSKIRREYNKITDCQTRIDKIKCQLEDLEKLQTIERDKSNLAAKDELIEDKNKLEQLIKKSEEIIDKIIQIEANIDKSVKSQEKALRFGELYDMYKSKSSEIV